MIHGWLYIFFIVWVQVVELDAGHCPHDEVPELVNSHLLRFIADAVMPSMAEGGKAGSSSKGGSSVTAAGGTAAAVR